MRSANLYGEFRCAAYCVEMFPKMFGILERMTRIQLIIGCVQLDVRATAAVEGC